jgi:hypothetical protein
MTLGLFGIFGRSQDIQRLDRAFRACGLHPRLVADAIKITVLKQLKEAAGGQPPDQRSVETAAELLSYCALGDEEFAENNGQGRAQALEARLVRAIEAGEGLDARLVLLALHAKLAHPSIVARYGLAVG